MNNLKIDSSWEPPKSPVGMLQEDFWPDTWKILVACILHNQTARKQVDKVYPELFERYPSAKKMSRANPVELAELLRPLGLYNRRSKSLIRFSEDFQDKEWEMPSELYACGDYADDCYSVFCLGNWEEVESEDGSLKRYLQWLRDEYNAGAPATEALLY
jgi:methyl-CpG-binding domain protein 4